MANFAELQITFDIPGAVPLNDVLSFDGSNPTTTISETAKNFSSVGNFDRGSTAQESAAGYYAALVRDYGFQYTITYDSSITVTVTATDYDVEFSAFSFPGLSHVYTPPVAPTALEIDTITATTADGGSECTKARFDFTVNNATYPIDILTPVVKTANNAGELFFDYDRFPTPTVTLSIQDAVLETDNETLPRVSTYTFVDDNISVLEAFGGATVTIEPQIDNVGDIGLNFTYSLDDIDYQLSNVFTGLLAGNYTAYIKDGFGCKRSASFEVIGVSVDKPEPIFRITETNGLKHFEYTTNFDYKTSFPNFDNSLVNEQGYYNIEEICYKQPVQTNDISTEQIQSNYETITVNVRRLSDNEIVATPTATEVKTNILQKDKRDCKIIGGATGKTHIYFPGGNLYTPDTLDVEGTYTNPNLLLPNFLDSGTLASGVGVTLSDNAVLIGDFIVEDDVYDDSIGGRALQISATYTGSSEGTDAIVQSLYNALDYNVWEYSVNWDSLPEDDYYIEINATDTDPRYDDKLWYTEPINSAERQNNTTYIEYYNNENFAQMDYSTGIKNFIRVPSMFVLESDSGEKDTFTTDSGKVILLKEIISSDITLNTDLIPQYVKKRIEIASAHKDNLIINGLPVAQQEKGESESKISEKNRYYTYTGTYRLDESIVFTDESGVVSDSGEVLGTGSGNFVLSINL